MTNSTSCALSGLPEVQTGARLLRTERLGLCPICAGPDSKVLFRTEDRLHGTPGEFIYRRCDGCRTVFQDPKVIHEDLGICYPKEYYTHETESDPDDSVPAVGSSRRLRDTVRQAVKAAAQRSPAPLALLMLGKVLAVSSRLRARAFFDLVDELIPRWPLGLRALEVGCGTGKLMVKLQRAGWEMEGVEWDPVAADVARKRSGRPVWEGDFSEIALPQAQYHLVAMSHVFEHLDDPAGGLGRIKDLLAPGGRAVLFYPNPESAGARVYGKAWRHWDAPRHLVLPPLASLAAAAERVGLKAIQSRTRTGASIDHFAPAAEANPSVIQNSAAGRMVAAVARALIALGAGVGEEAIVVLQKGAR